MASLQIIPQRPYHCIKYYKLDLSGWHLFITGSNTAPVVMKDWPEAGIYIWLFLKVCVAQGTYNNTYFVTFC